MSSRRRQAANRSRQTREEARREPGISDTETPSKSRSKALSCSARAHQASPASRSDRNEDTYSNKKTPKRLNKCKQWTSGIHSPSNDSEQQHEIFWDPNSPTSFRLENEKKKQPAKKCTVEISDIVNRIAPKDEKPTTSDASYLGLWIGENAIPCTPVISRPRKKLNRSRILKTEQELMELAKQLDRNLIEHKDQHDDELIETAHSTVNAGTVQENDNGSFLEAIIEEDVSLALKSVSQSSVTGAATQSSQKSVDRDAEEALNALFDCSTQKVNGRLSQGLSDISTSSFQGVPVQMKNGSRENQLLTKDPPEKNTTLGFHTSLTKVHSDFFLEENKSSNQAIANEKEKAAADMVLSVSSSQDDFEDDWGEDILEDDSFVMQITQNPELISTPKSHMLPEKSKYSNSASLDGRSDCTTKASTTKEHSSFKFVPKKLTDSEGSKTKSGLNGTVTAQSQKTELCPRDRGGLYKVPISEPQGPSGGQITKQNNTTLKSTNPSTNCEVSKMFTFSSKSLSSRGEKDQLVKTTANTVVHRNATSTNVGLVHCDEWDDPRFSDEVLDMFCKSDSLWDKDDDDDDLMYQVCNDVEILSQVQASDEKTKFCISSRKGSTVSDNKNGNHNSAAYSCSSTFSGYVPNSNKVVSKGVSPASVSGNCLNTFQSITSQRPSQTSGTFNRSNSMPSRAECIKTKIKEPNPQSSVSSTTNAHAPSKYSFTKIKPSHVLSVHTNKTFPGSESSSKVNHFQGFGESNINTLTNVLPSQQSSLKRHLSESTIHSSKVFVLEDRSKKCSTDEIEQKKQEALARRKLKARAFSSDKAPT